MTNFPTSLDDSVSLPDPSAVNKQNNPSHSALHSTENGAIKAVEVKLGTGSSTPSNNTLLRGNGSGTSAWSQLTSAELRASITDETGTGLAVFGTSPTLTSPAIDTINESTPANGVTIDGLNVKDGKLNTNNSVVTNNITDVNVTTAKLADSAVTSAKVAAGMPVQVVTVNSSTFATGTTTVPSDNTIPQNTEGTEFLTLAITPKSATNMLVIEVHASLARATAAGDIIGAIFQDTTANALAAVKLRAPAADDMTVLFCRHSMVAGTTSATTFKFRAGPTTAATITFNGEAGASTLSTATKSSIVITEYKA